MYADKLYRELYGSRLVEIYGGESITLKHLNNTKAGLFIVKVL